MAGIVRWTTDPDQREFHALASGLRGGAAPHGAERSLTGPRTVVVWIGADDAGAAADERIAAVDGPLEDLRHGVGSTIGAHGVLERARDGRLAAELKHLGGDFALAIVDTRERAMVLARDRFGVRPLYWARISDGVAFASRPAALLGLAGIRKRADPGFVMRFAGSHYRYIDNVSDASAYADIRQVPAAHIVEISRDAEATTTYWSLQDLGDRKDDAGQLAEEYRALLGDAVLRRLALFRSPAFTLSGGMDSSSVAALAHAAGHDVTAYTATYADRRYDESADIQPMLGAVVENWHPVAVEEDDVLPVIRRMIAAHDEPVATATWLAHFRLCERAAQAGHDALFGGLGGDELNAGEYEHFVYHFADLRASGDAGTFDREVASWAAQHDHPIYRKSRAILERELARLVDASRPGRCLADQRRLLRYERALAPLWDLRSFKPVMDHPFGSYLKNRCYQDATRETIPCCLRAEDRNVRAFGLGHSLPFLDHRLVEFMFRVPGTLKIRDGVSKRLLRDAMRGLLPEETRTRVKKTGWNAPAHRWFSGVGRERLLDLISDPGLAVRDVYDLREVRRIVDDHDMIIREGQPREDHMMFLWQLVNLELWFREMRISM